MARPKTMAKRKIVNLPETLVNAVDEFRYSARIPTESEAIRRLLIAGFATRCAHPSLYDLAKLAADVKASGTPMDDATAKLVRAVEMSLHAHEAWIAQMTFASEGVAAEDGEGDAPSPMK